MKAIDQSIKNQIIKLRQEGVCSKDIVNLTGVSRPTIMRLSKHIKLTREQKHYILIQNKDNSFSDEQINFLKNNYCYRGPKFCSEQLNRSYISVSNKAHILGLTSNPKQRRIIQKLDGNKVLCKCKKHGVTIYRNPEQKTKRRQGLVCVACSREYTNIFNKTEKQKDYRRNYQRERQKDPKFNFITRIRRHLNHCYHGKQVHFRELGYTGQELRDHLYRIKEQQNNKCPICGNSYTECKMTIEHIIPIATANSKQEIINLFALSNLSVMCLCCNCSKQKNNFDEWKNKKLLERKNLCLLQQLT